MKSFIQFKWKYLVSILGSLFISKKAKSNNYYFVLHHESRNWIFGSKARRLLANSNLPGQVVYTENYKNLPDGEGYYFLHQKYLARSIRYNPHLLKRKLIVMYTHTETNKWYSTSHLAYILSFAHKIVCLNSGVKNELLQMGIAEKKIHMMHLASDPVMFTPKQRNGAGAVGLSMAFGPRKNPGLVAQIIKLMPHRSFILVGPKWHDFIAENKLSELPNFKYYSNIEYESYPELYHQMDVLLSPSVLEGGPVPILEAMLCNVVPVASRTGFCPDIITHGQNGFLFNTNATPHEVAELIDEAFKLKTNVREGIEKHSWTNYGTQISELFQTITV